MSAVLVPGGPRAKPSIAGSSRSASFVGKQTAPGARAMSFENSFEKNFAERFAVLLRANFANPTQVASAFGVRERTAENWWNGTNSPSGWQVAKVFLTWPDEAREALGGQCSEKSDGGSGRSSSSREQQQTAGGSRRKQRAA